MPTKIYHNPKCGTSRNTLALIENAGIQPEVIEYLKTPPSKQELKDLITKMGVPIRDIIRAKEPLYLDLKLDNMALSEDALLDAMVANPILINRPIVVTDLGVKLCRPSELVLDILSAPQQKPFAKEDGTPVVDEKGNCLL
jgi:arsenate reductase (glutaredoxin)